MSDRRKRLHTLHTDGATQGLDERQRVELELLLGGEPVDASYEEAAAAIELALLPHGEAMPEGLHAALLAQAGDYFGFTDARQHEQTRGKPLAPRVGEREDRPQLREGKPKSGPKSGPRAYLDPESELGEIGEDAILVNSIIADSVNEVIDASVLADSSASRKAATSSLNPAALSSAGLSASEVGLSQAGQSVSRGAANTARYAAYFSAVAALVVLGLALWLFSQRGAAELDPEALQAQVQASEDALEWKFAATDDAANGQGAGGSVIWSSELQAGVMKIQGLEINDPTELQYQLWIVDSQRAGHPVDGGVFDIDGSGQLTVPIDAKLLIGEPGAFVITVEAPGGVVVSSQERVAMVAKAG